MKIDMARFLGIAAIAAVVAMTMVGCGEKGAAEKTGAALDNAAQKTVETANTAVEKTGAAVEKTGADMQK